MKLSAPSWGTKITAGLSAAVVLATGLTLPAYAAITPEDLTFELLSQPLPAADLLDFDVADGVATDHSPKAWPLTAGSATSTLTDATLDRRVIVGTAGAESAWRTPLWSDADYAALADGFAIEVTFRIDTPITGSNWVDVISGQQSGGIGIEAYANDATSYTLQLWATGKPQTTLKYGQWYHVVGFFDGSKAGLYVDGGLAASVNTTTFKVKPDTAAARYVVIGGDATGTGGVSNTFGGRLASARIYSEPLTELEAYRLSRLEVPSLDTVGPLLQPASELRPSIAVGAVYSVPQATAIDDTGVLVDGVVATVTGPDGTTANLDVKEDGSYEFTPAIAGAYTLRYAALDAAGNLGYEDFAITATDGDEPGEPADPVDPVEPEEPATPAEPADDGPSIRFGAVGDIHDSWSELAEAFDFWHEQEVDATLFVGDLTNNGTASEYNGLKATVDANLGDIELVAALGNHDIYSGIQAYDLFKGATGQQPNADYVINGYHFITVSPGAGTLNEETGYPSQSDTGNYAYAASWLQTRLADAVAEDPELPVFVLVHHPLRCTHYVSNEWYGNGLTNNQCGDNFESVFDEFPQAVVWGGHIHTPNNISTSIWQDGGFTTVNAPPLAYFEMESGIIGLGTSNDSTPDDAGDNRQTSIVDVEGSVVTIRNYDLLADEWIDQTWSWDVAETVGDSSAFPFTDARAGQTSGPVWASGSAVSVTGISNTGAQVSFPQAAPAPNAVQDIVHKYRYDVVDVATGTVVNTFTQWSGFYALPLPATRGHSVWNLRAGTEYEVRITPINTWGKTGAFLAQRFTTTGGSSTPEYTFEQLAAPMPVADLLDADFRDGTLKDRSTHARTFTAGTAAIGADAELERDVATFTGSTAQAFQTAWGTSDYAAVNDGFAIESVFKVDEFSASYVDFFGNMQSAGVGFEISKGSQTGRADLELWAHVAGSYKVPEATNALEYGKWYHAIGTYDGSSVKLYLNGALAGSVPATGSVTTPGTASRKYVIGGDVTSSGGVEAPFVGSIALARMYGDPVSELDAHRLANRELTSIDKVKPLLRVAATPPSTGVIGSPITVPAARAADNSGSATVATSVAYGSGAEVELTANENGTSTFTPQLQGTYTLAYTATDAAGNTTQETFQIAVAEPLGFDDYLAPIPAADLLDVDFTDGVFSDRSPRAHEFAVGTAPITVDPTLGTHVATYTRNTAEGSLTPWSDADYALTRDGFTIEAAFRVADFASGEVDILSNTQSSGFSLLATKGSKPGKANLEMWAHVGGYKIPSAANALTIGEWAHAVGTFDGTTLKLYLNGELVSSVAATGTITTPGAASRKFVVGGDVSSSGTVEYPFAGAISAARIYSEPLEASDILRLASREVPANDKIDPLLRVDPAPAGTGTVGKGYAVPAPAAVDDSGVIATTAVTFTGPDGVELSLTETDGGFVATPQKGGVHTLTYAVADRAGNTATATYEVQVAQGDVTAPTVTVKSESKGRDGVYSTVSFKLYDAGKVDRVVLNGKVKDLSDNVWSDLNDVKPGAFGAVEGANTLRVLDVAGNVTTITFTLDTVAPTVTVKDGASFTVGSASGYELVSYKLYDAGKVDRLVLNGVAKDLSDNVWSDLNGVKPGTFGALLGENTLEVIDVAGNVRTVTFTLVAPAPAVPAWASGTFYVAGDRVSYEGSVWVAQWWTQNQQPGDPTGAWSEVGAGVQTPSGVVPAWTASWIYTGGETVAYGGRVYTAKWWTRNQVPGDPYGPWQSTGVPGVV